MPFKTWHLSPMATNKKPGKWRAQTLAVRGGQTRSLFQETAEGLFLTSGYAYEDAEEAELRFKGKAEGYQYSRFGNPTATMFEARMAALEGAPVARATASGLAAVTAPLVCAVRSAGHVMAANAMFGACRDAFDEVLLRLGVAY